MYFFFDVKALHEFFFSTELFFNIKGMKASYIQLNLDFSKLKGNEKCFEKSGINRPYSYSRYWTGTSLQWGLMRGNIMVYN